MSNNLAKIKCLHLGVSAFIVIIVGLTYGINPNKVLPLLFDFEVESKDLSNVFRSIMGLYLSLAAYWIFGVIKKEAWKGATISNILFMGGLAFGRIISLIIDGIPSNAFLIGLTVEILALIWGIYNLKMYIIQENSIPVLDIRYPEE
jgi:hypothetical protein